MIELLISIVILGFALLALLLGNIYVQEASERAHERMLAAQDAQRAMELIRNASITGNFPANVANAFPNGALVGAFNNLSGEQIRATYVDPTTDPLDITVTTTWQERGRRNATFQLRTLMTQRTNP